TATRTNGTQKYRKTIKHKPPKEKQARGRPRIYEINTILKPLDPDYFKKYYESIVKVKIDARILVPLPSIGIPSSEIPAPEIPS
ncbi:MAG: hypothetical protein ACKPKO_17075, partial [Candidatus Fonsibacter sp.]